MGRTRNPQLGKLKPLRLTATTLLVKIHLPEFLFPCPDSSYYIAVLMDVNKCRDPSLRIGMTSTWRCHFEQSEKSLHCCHEKREPLIMLSCRNPRGTNFVCASRDHLLPALSIPAAFVATLCRDDKEGELRFSL